MIGFRGFTLVEVMVTIAIAAILISVGAPSLTSFYQSVRAEQNIDTIQTTLAFARNQAMSYDINVIVCPVDSCDEDGDWRSGIQVFTQNVPQNPPAAVGNANRVQPNRMTLRVIDAFNSGDAVKLTPTTITFMGSGRITGLPARNAIPQPVTLSYCPDSKGANAIGLEISPSGSTHITKTGASCTN